jgi:hypothetical protein
MVKYRLAETVFKEKHGVWDPMQVVSYPPPLKRERGGVGKIVEHICLLISKTIKRKNEITEMGEGRGES